LNRCDAAHATQHRRDVRRNLVKVQSINQFIKQQRTKGHSRVATIYNSYSAQSTDNVYTMYRKTIYNLRKVIIYSQTFLSDLSTCEN